MKPENLSRRTLLSRSVAITSAGFSPSLLRAQGADPLRVGVIGHSGRGDYGHGIDKVWLNIEETAIVAVADPVDTGRAKAIERLKLSPDAGFPTYKEMLTKAKPDIVAIGPRHVDQHCDMAVAAAQSSARGIYIEKPFCRDLNEADRIVAACKETNTRLAIAHRNRYHPVLPVIRQLIKDGKLGQVLEIRLRGKEDQRGGLLDLWVLGSHILNLAHYFAGDPTACTAGVYQDGRPVTKEDVVDGSEGIGPLAGNEVHARWETKSNIPIYFDSIQNAGSREAGFGLQMIGTEGIIDFRADREPLAHILSGNPHIPSSDERKWIPITSAGIGKPEPIEDIRPLVAGHFAPARDLLSAIQEGRPTLCNAEDGRTITEMIMAVFASHRSGGNRVEIPSKTRTNAFADW